METEVLTPSQLNELINQTLQFAYPAVTVEGEIASLKLSQGKWVFFDLKDDHSVLNCFMPAFQLQQPLEDGMLVRVECLPKLTQWGRFSLTVRSVQLAGEGSAKKAFELLRAQFEKEGLFALERKRLLPRYPHKVALITSAQAAAYNDFVTIVEQRYHALAIDHLQVQVQGADAPDQLVRALTYCNQPEHGYQVIVMIRGGGSAEDLQAFNSEPVVRAVYGCAIPTLVGIGHEDDICLAELAADVRAATPTDAARLLVPESQAVLEQLGQQVLRASVATTTRVQRCRQQLQRFEHSADIYINTQGNRLNLAVTRLNSLIGHQLERSRLRLMTAGSGLRSLNPKAILARGYSIATLNGVALKDTRNIKPTSQIMLQLHQGSTLLQPADKSVLPKRKKPANAKTQTSLRF